MNRSPGGGHWLDIALEGTKSNRDGIGARIQVVTKSGTQYNHMTTSFGYASSSCGPVHFGLGADEKAASVVIHWPSGIVQTLKDVSGDRDATREGGAVTMRLASGAISVLTLAALLGTIAAADQKAPPDAPVAFDKASQAATDAREHNRVEDAIPLYRQAVKLRPTWAEGWWFLGELLYDQNQYPEARDALRRLIGLDRNSSAGFALLGLCEFETKEYDKSLNHIYQARRLGLGDDPQIRRVVLFHEMLLLTRLQQYESAMQVLVNVVKDGGAGASVIEAAGLAGLRRPILPEDLPPGDKDLVERAGRASARWPGGTTRRLKRTSRS